MAPALPGQRVSSALDSLYPFMRFLGTLLIVILGSTLFGLVGSLAYPVGGVGAIVGAILGALISLSVGVMVTGLWKSFIPQDNKTYGLGAMLPHSVAVAFGAHGAFELIVTIHEAVGIEVQGHMPWKRSDTYLEVECGNNPVKRTCVKNDGKFNEACKIQVTAQDEGMLIRVKDQDLFGATDIGYVYVDIQRDVIEAQFPRHKEFVIEAGEHDRLRYGKDKAYLVLSFDHQDSSATPMQPFKTQVHGSHDYGAVNFLQTLEFNPNAKVVKEHDIFTTRHEPSGWC
eukprot:TRINITY_DN14295_c0_g1_i2.p1 TRINITY_DN14295_c0_g1~~TRINITY_DN14295_c0_g1_i2.p1  ORF type:complete len:285 (+),score=39.22 TRINITY_DN14295_c0_g1_i2:102-956(+)